MERATAKGLLVVTGKGGVGKSTVALALAMAGARRGMRTMLAEVSARNDIPTLLGASESEPMKERQLMEGLQHISIDRDGALREYLRYEVGAPVPASALMRSRAFSLFTAASPGLSELLMIGKVSELTRRARSARRGGEYDLVVLDAPATGNAVALLSAPSTFATIAKGGPIARQARAITEILKDERQTGALVVADAEQMAVTETLSLRAALQGPLGVRVEAIVVNRMLPSPLAADELDGLEKCAVKGGAIRSALWLDARARMQHRQLARLRRRLPQGASCCTLPLEASLELGQERERGMERLSQALERRLR